MSTQDNTSLVDRLKSIRDRAMTDREAQFSFWADDKIPPLQFSSDWLVQIIPPARGAIIRFRILLPKSEFISVYLDCYNALGGVGQPYWEAFDTRPGNEPMRFLLHEHQQLMDYIKSRMGVPA